MKIVSSGTRLAGIAAAVFLLAACETAPDRSTGSTGGGAAAPVAPGGASVGVAPATEGQLVPGSQAELEALASHRVFFQYDRHDLTDEARVSLQSQAAWLKSHPTVTISIAGNCDERGTREYNLALGERRANSAKDYLMSLGVDPSRMSTLSYGKERPIALCADESCWSQNRNATTQVN